MNRSPQSLEKRRIANREWCRAHRDRRNAYLREWCAANPTLKAAQNRRSVERGRLAFEHGKPRAEAGRCSLCKLTKPATEFYRSNASATGLHGWCKECSDRKTTEAGRRRLGVEPEEFARLLAAQGGRCAICRALPGDRAFHLDHDHESNRVRGILCHACNLVLGLAKDNPATLRAAIAYLEEKA